MAIKDPFGGKAEYKVQPLKVKTIADAVKEEEAKKSLKQSPVKKAVAKKKAGKK